MTELTEHDGVDTAKDSSHTSRSNLHRILKIVIVNAAVVTYLVFAVLEYIKSSELIRFLSNADNYSNLKYYRRRMRGRLQFDVLFTFWNAAARARCHLPGRNLLSDYQEILRQVP